MVEWHRRSNSEKTLMKPIRYGKLKITKTEKYIVFWALANTFVAYNLTINQISYQKSFLETSD